MMLSERRISRLLQTQQFELVSFSKVGRSAIFARQGPADHLFERVRFKCQGSRGEAVVAWVEASVVHGTNATKGLLELELLAELGHVKERVDKYGCWVPGYGRAIVETTDEAKDWERRFAEVAPQQAAILAREKGPGLLAATTACRVAAEEVRERLGDLQDLQTSCSRLEHRASPEQRREVRRLAKWPGVLQIPCAEVLYEIATTGIVLCAPNITSLRVNIEADPLNSTDLMWLIQILVDRIIIETAWQPNGN